MTSSIRCARKVIRSNQEIERRAITVTRGGNKRSILTRLEYGGNCCHVAPLSIGCSSLDKMHEAD